MPEAGATTLGGTTGAGAGAGGGGAGAAAGGLAGLGGLALFAYLGFMEGKRQGKRYDKEANSPSGLAKRKFAEDYPDVFTDKGQSKDKPIKGAIPKFSGFDFNAKTGRLEYNKIGHSNIGQSWEAVTKDYDERARKDRGD